MASSPPRYNVGFAWLATLRPAGRSSLRGPTAGFSPGAGDTLGDRARRRAQEPAMRSPTAARRRMTDLNRRTDLLEREAELEQIGDALRISAAGSGRIVVIEGAPGIGKSSLLDEAAALAEAERMAVLRARGGVMEREFALGVVIQLLAPMHRAAHRARARTGLRRCRGTGAPAVRGGSRPSRRRRSPVRTIPRPALAVREAGRRAAARPPRRRCALGRRAFASVPRLPGGQGRGDPGLCDPRGSDGRGICGARSPDQADRDVNR